MIATSALRRLLAVCAVLIAGSVSLPAVAQLRTFPANAEAGELNAIGQGWVRIDGNDYTLAPGAQIRNEQNLIVLPVSALGEYDDVPVRVQWDPQGQIWKLWMLTESEIQALDQ